MCAMIAQSLMSALVETRAAAYASLMQETPTRTQVAIIGSGPAGLLLGQLLHRAGVDNIVIERQSAEYVLGRIRAGILEQVTNNLMDETNNNTQQHREGIVHHAIELAFDGRRH